MYEALVVWAPTTLSLSAVVVVFTNSNDEAHHVLLDFAQTAPCRSGIGRRMSRSAASRLDNDHLCKEYSVWIALRQ